MNTEELIISVRDADKASMAKAVASLKRAGLKNTQALTEAGIVTGKATAEARTRIAALECVQAVETSGDVSIPPGEG